MTSHGKDVRPLVEFGEDSIPTAFAIKGRIRARSRYEAARPRLVKAEAALLRQTARVGLARHSEGPASMGYRSLAECVRDLEATGQLVVIDQEVDPYLEVAAIQRRVYQAGGPALLFRRAKGTAFPLLGNLFGTLERAKYLFRDALESVRRLVELKVDPGALARTPGATAACPRTLWRLLPRRVRSGPILAHQITIDQLPQIQCWPMDGGPFITLPQVYTEDPDRPGLARSNLGMYRVQLAGNQYVPNREVGLHYQIHRGHRRAPRGGDPPR